MSLTKKYSPYDTYTFMPVYNPLEFVYDSTNNGEAGFQYVFDVFYEGSVTYDHRFLIDSDPEYGFGRFDVHSVLETQLTSDISISMTKIDTCPNSISDFDLEIGEKTDASGVTATLETLSTNYFWNASLYHDEFIDYSGQYNLSSGSTNKFLTNSPRTLEINSGEYNWLYGLSEAVTKAKVITYDSNGSENGEFDIDYDGSAYSLTEQRMFRIPTGWNLNDISDPEITVISGATPILDSDVDSYTVQAYAGSTASSETFTYNVVDRCVRTTPKDVVFLNSLGGFDRFTFELANIPTYDKETNEYKSDFGTTQSDGTISYSKAQRLKSNYYTKTSQKIRLTSNWISEAESSWLKELFDSPEVYIHDTDNAELISIQGIDETSYEIKEKEREKLFRIEFTLTYGWDNYRQRW